MIVAGLHFFINEELTNIVSDTSLKDNLNVTMNNVRAVLCYFNVSIPNLYKSNLNAKILNQHLEFQSK